MEKNNGANKNSNAKNGNKQEDEKPEKITLYTLLNVESNATKQEIVFFLFNKLFLEKIL